MLRSGISALAGSLFVFFLLLLLLLLLLFGEIFKRLVTSHNENLK